MSSPWWHRRRHEDRRPFLLARHRILLALRHWFAQQGFLEVDPAILQVSPGNETHLHGFSTELVGPDPRQRRTLHLHTSPEFACKKLLAAGETRLMTLGHVFRNRERGPLHHPEFTMLEWYRAHEAYDAVIEDSIAILRAATRAVGAEHLVWRGQTCDPAREPERLTVAHAFARHAGIDLFATIGPDGSTDRDALADAVDRAGIRPSPDDRWSDLFAKVLVERIEPELGRGRVTVLDEYPIVEAALARPKPADPRVALRFELYACGVELANGFDELTDAVEQRRRFIEAAALKERIYGESAPIDEEFLAAVAAMPPAAGVALGFDRLVMLATGASDIEQVVWTPLPR
jgi:lysyl-tRNA synthetase class 2